MTTHTGTRDGAATKLPREIWVLVGGSFLIAIGFGLVAPALPAFARSFDVGVTAAAVVVSSFAAMRLIFAPVAGRLVTRFGERPIYLLGITIVALGTLACAVAGQYWQLLLFRTLSGVGSCMFTVAAVGLLIRIAPPEARAKASGVFATSFVLGSITGPAVGGGLVAVSLRAPFLVYGVALLLVVVFVWAMLRNSELAARAGDDGAPILGFRTALRRSGYRAALVGGFANGWVALGARVSLIPLAVAVMLGLPSSFAGVALAVFAAGDAVVLLFSGRLADSWGRRPVAICGYLALAAGTVLLGQADGAPFFLAASLLCGIGAGAIAPSQSAAVADVLGTRARGGSVLAGFQMAQDVGSITGPLLAGVLADVLSFPVAFAVTGAVAALAALVWALSEETLPRKGNTVPAGSAESVESTVEPAAQSSAQQRGETVQ